MDSSSVSSLEPRCPKDEMKREPSNEVLELFAIPEEVFYGSILPKLDWNDLMRLRRASKYSKHLAEDYIINHPELAPEIEINETDKTLDKFMDLRLELPVTTFFLNNLSGPGFYEDQASAISAFLNKFGPQVVDLRLSHLSRFLFDKEWDFFEKLPNLERLEANDYGTLGEITCKRIRELMRRNENEIRSRDRTFPSAFKTLKRLQLGCQSYYTGLAITFTVLHFLNFCESLEYVALPHRSDGFTPDADSTIGFIFQYLKRNILNEVQESPNGPNLKIIDFQNTYLENERGGTARIFERQASKSFLDLCETCNRFGIKLMNVNAGLFNRIRGRNFNPEMGRCVVSLVDLSPYLTNVNLTNLTGLDIKGTCSSNVFTGSPNWPSLKTLKITVDSEMLNEGTERTNLFMYHRDPENAPVPSGQLFEFLFSNVSYSKLEELYLAFSPEVNIEFSVERAQDVVSACPNLKKLSLVNWIGNNNLLWLFWAGLRRLEELSLDSCRRLADSAFVGPLFLNLKRLKKLSLKGLDQMPEITDALFESVLQHISLTHLTLSCVEPIRSVTAVGIRALQVGKFAASIEKFPFNGWELADCSGEEFLKLESEFRSHNMF